MSIAHACAPPLRKACFDWPTRLRRLYYPCVWRHMTSSSANDGWPYPVYASSRVTEHKSAFLAHATTLKDTSELETLLEHLRALPRMKKTTHCMLAYRISGPSDGPVNTGQDDGGEGGAGDRLARLLELSGRENVVVVVWRWATLSSQVSPLSRLHVTRRSGSCTPKHECGCRDWRSREHLAQNRYYHCMAEKL